MHFGTQSGSTGADMVGTRTVNQMNTGQTKPTPPAHGEQHQMRDRLLPAARGQNTGTAELASRKPAIFDDLVHQYEAPIGRYLYSLVGDYETSRDLSQDTFISAYQNYEPGRIHNVQAWLYRIATNKAMSHFRRKKILRWTRLDKLIDAGFEPGIDGHSDSVATRNAVQQALGEMEPDKRASPLLKAAGFSHYEIADQLGCSPGAARTRLSRAREEFRAHFGNER